VSNLDYTLLSPVSVDPDHSNTPLDMATVELAWRATVTDDDSTDNRIAEYRERFNGAFDRLSLAQARIDAFLLVQRDGLRYRQAAEKLDSSPTTVHRWEKQVTERLRTDLGVKPSKRKRKLADHPTAAELATVAGLLTIDPVTAELARKGFNRWPKHPSAKVTVTRGEPRQRLTCKTLFGILNIGYFETVTE